MVKDEDKEDKIIKGKIPDDHEVEYCLEDIAIDEEKLPQIKKEIEKCLIEGQNIEWEEK